ncbi:MerR family transcriptional regulator [Streptomyces sp. GSL17-111]|uniref:MerR family transcriptional regulator n=1 Tax=Streptomyces sp. GSL17-111 TaxID=3121596 RepID=UPI0030F41CD0
MRIGELSRRTGVPVPTVKFYVREGLLPPGRLTSPNQAHYGEEHERRLRLIRALIGVGGLSVAATAEVLAAIDDPALPVHKALGAASHSIAAPVDAGAGTGRADDTAAERAEDPDPAGDGATDAARAAVEDLLARRGWRVSPRNNNVTALVSAAAALTRVGHGDFLGHALEPYADAAERVAEADLDYVAGRERREDLVERAVVGTVLGDAVLTALRRIAQVDASARRFGDRAEPPGAQPPSTGTTSAP